MTIFIAHAPNDTEVAETLQKFLERRGLFAERETGERGFRPLLGNDALVVLWSKDALFSPYRLQIEKRALDAWAEGRLVLVKLDHQFAPVGLRDLDFVDASFEQQRDLVAWPEIVKRAEKIASMAALNSRHGDMADAMRGGAPAPQAPQSAPGGAARAEPPMARKRGGGAVFWIVAILAILAGAGAAAVLAAVWLTNRIGAAPGSLSDLQRGANEFGLRYGLPEGTGFWIAAGLLALGLLFVILVFTARPKGRRASARREEAEEVIVAAPAPSAPVSSQAVFISYAQADSPVVLPVCEAVKQAGSELWLDKDGIGAGESWAGEIVRAIKAVKGVAVMCSKAAFESDHVKREVYLADRYKKHMLPVFIEEAALPEDFEYFFAGVQWLKLHETPEPERGAVMARALAAV